MRAKVQTSDEGAVQVWIQRPNRAPLVVAEIGAAEVRDLMDALTQLNEGDEPDYATMAEELTEELAEQLDLDWRRVADLRRAVHTVVAPGPPFEDDVVVITI